MESLTFTVTNEVLLWGYASLHVLYGLVTHYHSVAQVRKWNKGFGSESSKRVGGLKMFMFFMARMSWGLPSFFALRIISPVGNRWHMKPAEIYSFDGLS